MKPKRTKLSPMINNISDLINASDVDALLESLHKERTDILRLVIAIEYKNGGLSSGYVNASRTERLGMLELLKSELLFGSGNEDNL